MEGVLSMGCVEGVVGDGEVLAWEGMCGERFFKEDVGLKGVGVKRMLLVLGDTLHFPLSIVPAPLPVNQGKAAISLRMLIWCQIFS